MFFHAANYKQARVNHYFCHCSVHLVEKKQDEILVFAYFFSKTKKAGVFLLPLIIVDNIFRNTFSIDIQLVLNGIIMLSYIKNSHYLHNAVEKYYILLFFHYFWCPDLNVIFTASLNHMFLFHLCKFL